MKSGASDPFADDDAEEGDDATDAEASPSQSSQSSPDANETAGTSDSRSESSETEADSDAARGDETRGDEAPTTDSDAPESNPDETAPDSSESDSQTDADGGADDGGTEGLSREELPFILRRDKVKDERPEVHQLFVQRETHEEAVDAERALEKRLGEGLSRTDAREAIYLAGMRHLEDAETILRDWGYDL